MGRLDPQPAKDPPRPHDICQARIRIPCAIPRDIAIMSNLFRLPRGRRWAQTHSSGVSTSSIMVITGKLNGRTPFRRSLAVTLYGDSLSGRTPLSLEAEEAFTSLLRKVIESGTSSRRPVGAGPTLQRVRARKVGRGSG